MGRLRLFLALLLSADWGKEAKAACSFVKKRSVSTTEDTYSLAQLLNSADYVGIDGCTATSLEVNVTWSGTVLLNSTLNIYLPDLSGTLYNHTLTLSITGEDATVDASLISDGRFIQFWGLGSSSALASNYYVTVVLKDLVIDGFKVSCSGWAPGGAIMLDHAASLQVDGCEFRNNIGCNAGGGAIFLRSTVADNDALVLELQSSTFHNNTAWNGAGVMIMGNDAGSDRIMATVDNSTFTGNEAYLDPSDASSGNGGGFKVHNNAAATITNSRFYSNSAGANGGGLYANLYTTWVVEDTTIANNIAENSGGGAHLQLSGDATFRNVMFSSNEAVRDGGGGMYARDVFDVTWDNVTVEDNTSGWTGAGVGLVASSSLNATDCRFVNNVVSTGALAFLLSGSTMSSTRVDYVAGTAGSTMYAVYSGTSAQFRALESTFEGWNGDYAILHDGELMVLDSCVFDTNSSSLVVSLDATGAGIPPAVVRNAIVSTGVFEKSGYSDSLSDNVISCSSSISSAGGSDSTDGQDGGCDSGCLDQPLGVSCLCYTPVLALTGGSSCLTGSASVDLSISTAPQDKSDPAIHSYGDSPEGYATIKHSSTAAGSVRWSLELNDSSWSVVPEAGVLAPGGSIAVLFSQRAIDAANGVSYLALTVTGETSDETASSNVSTLSAFYECPAGFFYNDTDATTDSCVQCSFLPSPDGVDCTEPGNVLSSLALEPAYWRSGTESTDVMQCFNPSACVGGAGSNNDYCDRGYEGPFCGVCEPHYGMSSGNVCRSCEGQTHVVGTAIALVIVALLALTVALGMLAFLIRDDIAAPRIDSARKLHLGESIGSHSRCVGCFRSVMAQLQRAPMHKLRIPIVCYQIVTLFIDITGTELPPPYSGFMRGLSLINFNFTQIFATTCVIKVGFYGQLLLATLFPLGLLALLGFTFAVAAWRIRSRPPKPLQDPDARPAADPGDIVQANIEAVRSKHIMVVVLVAFLIYSYVSTIVFQTFACVSAGGVQYLRADLELLCHTPEHKVYEAFAAVMVIVYPVGVPALFLFVLMRHRRQHDQLRQGRAARVRPVARLQRARTASAKFIINRLSLQKRQAAPTNRSSIDRSESGHSAGPDVASALSSPYREERFWFEPIECLRRVMLTGVLVFARPNEPLQAGVGCIMSVVFLALFAYLQPFRDPGETLQYTLGFLIICFTMLESLFVKSGLVDSTSPSQQGFAVLLVLLSIFIGLAAIVQIWFFFPDEEETDAARPLQAKSAGMPTSLENQLAAAKEERKEDAEVAWAPIFTTPTRRGSRGGGGGSSTAVAEDPEVAV